MITFYLVLVSARLSEKWKSKTLFSWKKISLPDAQISQNYSSYYQLPFSESNRLIVSVICAWLSIKAISKTTKESNTRAAWSRGTEPQAAHRMKPRGLESVTEKVTGNSQPGACVDVLQRCWFRHNDIAWHTEQLLLRVRYTNSNRSPSSNPNISGALARAQRSTMGNKIW